MRRLASQSSFIRSRADQLADYLRGSIARGEIVDPLPNIRDWSSRLGVGRGTLETAIKILSIEGLLRVAPRKGIQINPGAVPGPRTARTRLGRWLFYGRDFPDLSVLMEVFAAVAERFQFHDIQLSIERCDAARFRAIHAKGENPGEMLMLVSLPAEFARLFADFRKSALVVGLPSPGMRLPYISIDVDAAFRHAVAMLARRGFTRVAMVITEPTRALTEAGFQKLCAETAPAVRGELVRMPIELPEQADAARRFAARISGRLGIIAVYSIPATVLISALLQRGIAVPRQVEVVGMNTTRMAVRVVPTPIYYPYPVEAFAKTVTRAALQYFEQGRLPQLRKLIPLEVVHPR